MLIKSTNSHSATRRAAFTLIELLVVIAIIAILAAILFPVFAQAREKARQTACLSNTKQLGNAIAMYTQDFDETPPNGWDPFGRCSGWAWQVYPYIKNVKVFQCLSDTNVGDFASSYGMNANLGGFQSGTGVRGSASGLPLSSYTAPAKTVMFFEVANSGAKFGYSVADSDPTHTSGALVADNRNNSNGESAAGWGIGKPSEPSGSGAAGGTTTPDDGNLKFATGWLRNSLQNGQFLSADGRHAGGSNFLMADTHAKWFKPNAVSAGGDNITKGACGGKNSATSGKEPQGHFVGWVASNTDCPDASIGATFSSY